MYRDRTVGVVVPAYNEAGLIGEVLETMPAFVDWIYVINDCSTDTTGEEIVSAARADSERSAPPTEPLSSVRADGGDGLLAARGTVHAPIGRVVRIDHHTNRGAGGAIKTGYLAARRDQIDLTVTMDGDGQMDPDQLPRLLDPLVTDKADYAKGNRLRSAEYREGMSRFRFVGNAILTFLTKMASGYWKTMDPQNGYTAITYEALTAIDLDALYEYYGYCNDLLVKLNVADLRVADVTMSAQYGDETSSISYPTYIWNVSGMLGRNYLWRIKTKYLVSDFHPLSLFYLLGIATTVAGVVSGIWSWYRSLTDGRSLFVAGALSLVLTLIGSLFVLLAMVFDMDESRDNEVQIDA